MAEHNSTGKAGEELAIRFLKAKGYAIVAQNYRYKKGEVDIIASKKDLLVFVEVKTRRGMAFGEPESFVNRQQTQLILQAAENYIFAQDWQHDVRFDVVAIYWKTPPEVVHFQDAFY